MEHAPWLPEYRAKHNCSELAGPYFLRGMAGRSQDQAVRSPESVHLLLAHTHNTVGYLSEFWEVLIISIA